jgi:phosphocarrier protein
MPQDIQGAILTRDVEIINKKGLHARATAKFVQCADAFEANITVTRTGETVGGTSIMGILTLGAGIGSIITLTASGPQAELAIVALTELINGRFGESE